VESIINERRTDKGEFQYEEKWIMLRKQKLSCPVVWKINLRWRIRFEVRKTDGSGASSWGVIISGGWVDFGLYLVWFGEIQFC
jgi:hypothetical protein